MKVSTDINIVGFFIITIYLIDLVVGEKSVKGIDIPSDFDGSFWPEMWRLSSDYPEDPMIPNRQEPNVPVDPKELAKTGIVFRPGLNPMAYDYPDVAMPYIPPTNGTGDDVLDQIRDELNYNYADIITVTSFFDAFWNEHAHSGGSVRYMIAGTGFFDVRDINDSWIRLFVQPGDFMELPSGMFHRFTVDKDQYITAMRLFEGDPVWTAYPRHQDVPGTSLASTLPARQEYIDTYLCGEDPDLPLTDPHIEPTTAPTVDIESSTSSEDDDSAATYIQTLLVPYTVFFFSSLLLSFTFF